MNGMPQPQVTLMLEIARCDQPTDCHLNHKVTKSHLKTLMDLNLIEVETRRCSTWKRNPGVNGPAMTGAERNRIYEEWGRKVRARHWQDRSEIHARLTDDGWAWYDEWKRTDHDR